MYMYCTCCLWRSVIIFLWSACLENTRKTWFSQFSGLSRVFSRHSCLWNQQASGTFPDQRVAQRRPVLTVFVWICAKTVSPSTYTYDWMTSSFVHRTYTVISRPWAFDALTWLHSISPYCKQTVSYIYVMSLQWYLTCAHIVSAKSHTHYSDLNVQYTVLVQLQCCVR